MIVLSDNDIILKLAGCNLLHQFFEILEAESKDILIATNASYALPKQAKKKLKNEDAVNTVTQFVKNVGRISTVNPELLGEIQGFKNMDGGESLLMVAAHENPDLLFATGDKRCLQSLIEHQSFEPIDQIFKSLQGRVYCLETAFMLLIENLGFEDVNQMVINRCVDDGVLRLAFGHERNIDNATDCLKSYCGELSFLLAPVAFLQTSVA